jgi:hypothetical protein
MTCALAFLNSERLVRLAPVDLAIIAIYFVIVLAIGFYLKRFAETGEDFFLAGREMTAWVAGLAFVSANLGSLELLGWAGSAFRRSFGDTDERETSHRSRLVLCRTCVFDLCLLDSCKRFGGMVEPATNSAG